MLARSFWPRVSIELILRGIECHCRLLLLVVAYDLRLEVSSWVYLAPKVVVGLVIDCGRSTWCKSLIVIVTVLYSRVGTCTLWA